MALLGSNVPRKEGPAKLCGSASYVDDLRLDSELFGVTLRSTVSQAKILGLDFDPDFPWDEFTVVTAADIPGKNIVTLIVEDQPVLADRVVHHAHEPIALIAHPDRARAYEALKHIQIRYEELPAVLDLDAAIAAASPPMKELNIDKGDVDKAMKRAKYVISGEYRVPHQEQAYIENNGMQAHVDADGVLVIRGSMQCPYYINKALGPALKLPSEKLRIVHATTGGAFGGKEEYPNILAAHAGLLALKSGRPVKMIYDRHEDMAATTKRHPALIRHRTGLDAKGKLIAQDIEVFMDGGAYVTLSPVVLSRGVLHAAGPYECPNVRVQGSMLPTNTPPNGAFRGFGAPQTLFAVETHWEAIAERLGISAIELRRRNIIHEGGALSTGQIVDRSVGAVDCLESTLKRWDFEQRTRDNERWNRSKKSPTWRGVGLATVHHGAGFTGSGERYLASRVSVVLHDDGRVAVESASTEMGQGATSIFTQIAGDALQLPYDLVEVTTPDTHAVPDSGPTVASRSTMIVGKLVGEAAAMLREAIIEVHGAMPTTRRQLKAAAKRLHKHGSSLRFEAQYQHPERIQWDEENYVGDAYPVYSYACVAVDLEVDRVSFDVTVRDVLCVSDIGRALHPLLAEGQVLGGTAQALGYALLENAQYRDGRMQSPGFTNYIIPTSMDLPPMDIVFVDHPYDEAPFGAKGVGELPMDAPAPAVAAALHQATGVLFTELPITPESIAARMNHAAQRQS